MVQLLHLYNINALILIHIYYFVASNNLHTSISSPEGISGSDRRCDAKLIAAAVAVASVSSSCC